MVWSTTTTTAPAISLRAYLAGQSLAGRRSTRPSYSVREMAGMCVEDADALIAELEKNNHNKTTDQSVEDEERIEP